MLSLSIKEIGIEDPRGPARSSVLESGFHHLAFTGSGSLICRREVGLLLVPEASTSKCYGLEEVMPSSPAPLISHNQSHWSSDNLFLWAGNLVPALREGDVKFSKLIVETVSCLVV